MAGLGDVDRDPDRLAVLEGSSLGPIAATAQLARRLASQPGTPPPPSAMLRLMPGAGGNAFAQQVGAHGAVHAIAAGSVSASVAIIEGCHRIRCGLADVVIAGGADAPLDPGVLETFAVAGILAVDPGDMPCRPFDVARKGTVLGEGAGVVVLESARHARRRGAAPLARIPGTGVNGEDRSRVAPDPRGAGLARAAAAALRGCGRKPDWIKSHGTGTRSNDQAECVALAPLLADAPITSLKSMLGHTLGASGGLELVATVLALHEGLLPATLGTRTIDPDLGRCRVPLEPERISGDVVLLLSQSLGGRTAALAVVRP